MSTDLMEIDNTSDAGSGAPTEILSNISGTDYNGFQEEQDFQERRITAWHRLIPAISGPWREYETDVAVVSQVKYTPFPLVILQLIMDFVHALYDYEADVICKVVDLHHFLLQDFEHFLIMQSYIEHVGIHNNFPKIQLPDDGWITRNYPPPDVIELGGPNFYDDDDDEKTISE